MVGVHDVGAYECPDCGSWIPEDYGCCSSCGWESMDAELADQLAAEAASMLDGEILEHYRSIGWSEDPAHKRILADDIVQRFENQVEDDG